MNNLDYEIKFYGHMMIETLLKNLKGSEELREELEKLKNQYCKNIVN